MNAAFLLVTSACLMGDAPAAPPPPAPAATAAPVAAPVTAGAPCSSCGGCSSCDSGCGCENEGFFARLRARFARHDDCGCGCAAPAPSCGCNAAPACGCESEGFLSRFRSRWGSSSSDCGCSAPVSSCGCAAASSCGCESGPSFWERLKSRFHRNECGCESGCNSGCNSGCGCNGTSAYSAPAAPATGEHIGAPKDGGPAKPLPKDTDKPKEAKSPAPFEVAPAATITIEKDGKNPF